MPRRSSSKSCKKLSNGSKIGNLAFRSSPTNGKNLKYSFMKLLVGRLPNLSAQNLKSDAVRANSKWPNRPHRGELLRQTLGRIDDPPGITTIASR